MCEKVKLPTALIINKRIKRNYQTLIKINIGKPCTYQKPIQNVVAASTKNKYRLQYFQHVLFSRMSIHNLTNHSEVHFGVTHLHDAESNNHFKVHLRVAHEHHIDTQEEKN